MNTYDQTTDNDQKSDINAKGSVLERLLVLAQQYERIGLDSSDALKAAAADLRSIAAQTRELVAA